eukprot:UN13056
MDVKKSLHEKYREIVSQFLTYISAAMTWPSTFLHCSRDVCSRARFFLEIAFATT